MDIRRVQMTGGSSFVVTLPKEWAEQQKIKKNDPVGILQQPDGTLLVTKKINEEPLQRSKEIDVSSINDPAYLFRLLIGTYINGFNIVRLTTKGKFQPFVRTVVRDYIQMTIGQEVVEETENVVAIKDLLNPSEMPFENTIKRMYVIIKTMHEDAITAFDTRNKTLANDVIQRDLDADRLNSDRPPGEHDHAEQQSLPENGDCKRHGDALLHSEPDHRTDRGPCGQDRIARPSNNR